MSIVFIVDGQRRTLHGDHDSIIDQVRDLRSYGHVVNQAKRSEQPARQRSGPTDGWARTSAHIRR